MFTISALLAAERPERVSRKATREQTANLGLLGKLTVERADGEHVFASGQVSDALQEAGFRMTPQGLRLRPAAMA